MPPKGFKKGYIRHPKTNEWIDGRVYKQEQEELQKTITPSPKPPVPKVRVLKEGSKPPPRQKVKDDLGPVTKNVKDDSDHAKVIISFKDKRGRSTSVQYVMSDLNLSENVTYEFQGAKRVTRIHLSLDGNVIEKL